MLTSTPPSTHRYHVAAVCGLPSRRMVAMTDGLGSARKATRSCGRGGLGMALRRSPPTVGLGPVPGPGANRGDVRPVDVEDHAGASAETKCSGQSAGGGRDIEKTACWL